MKVRTIASRRLILASLFMTLSVILSSGAGWAGSIFLTGHDPDFHAQSSAGENPTGAQHINQAAINFITDAAFNPFTTASSKLLFVESTISVPNGHRQGALGMNLSGFTNYDLVNASGLNAALNLLGTTYNAIVVASDFGGILTQAELNILNSRSADIINFLNAGGGLYAMAESNGGAGLTPTGGRFGFLPFVVSSTAFNQTETGITVTAFGAGLGLTNADVNGNFSHNIFTSTGGMNVVDRDAAGNILSLAVRSQITSGGVVSGVPEPASLLLFGSGLAALAVRQLRKFRR